MDLNHQNLNLIIVFFINFKFIFIFFHSILFNFKSYIMLLIRDN
jgi:hypothetical protein